MAVESNIKPFLTLELLNNKIEQIKNQKDTTLLEFSHYAAAISWLTQLESQQSLNPIGLMESFNEAFYHLQNVGDITIAWSLVSESLDSTNKENFYEQIGIWGYYSQVIDILEYFIGRISEKVDASCFLSLGNAHQLKGEHELAKSYFQKCLDISETNKFYNLQARVLNIIGNLFRIDKKHKTALQYLHRGLEISQTHQIHLQECVCFHFLGQLFNNMNNLIISEEYYLKSLAIAQKIDNIQWEANNYGNLVTLFTKLGKYTEALQASDIALSLAQTTNDRYVEAWGWHNRGLLFQHLSKPITALDCLKRSFSLFQEIGNPEGMERNQTIVKLLEAEDQFSMISV